MNLKEKLKEQGVKNLKEYGYPKVNADNIITDQIYRAFFETMLDANVGLRADVDSAIASIREEINLAKSGGGK